MVLSVVPAGLQAFASANTAAGEMISDAGSADAGAMFSAAVAAVGPIGANYLLSYASAQTNNLFSTLTVGAVHGAIGGQTNASNAAYLAADGV
ncbi:hypothetical protein A5724_23685 [Mycobacterium sp. ACS1612]|uniref:hypothetical protein n=1 Tax=Mycobacterium sp. ACS1612 TaxID=1834117 RepID=UPI0007FEED21|nr:hypothetical protein [Mycobacterium sp. ACS1612]OBF30228.1 hypothetical protein A5724_23685 [Mycobacterium sp. ACS1612]